MSKAKTIRTPRYSYGRKLWIDPKAPVKVTVSLNDRDSVMLTWEADVKEGKNIHGRIIRRIFIEAKGSTVLDIIDKGGEWKR